MPVAKSVLDQVVQGLSANPMWQDFSEANKRSGSELYGALKGFVTPPKDLSVGGLSDSRFLQAGPVVSAAVNRIMDPMTSPFTTMVGRPVEKATGGRVKKETAGNIASVLVPGFGEEKIPGELAREAHEFDIKTPVAARRAANDPVDPAPAGHARTFMGMGRFDLAMKQLTPAQHEIAAEALSEAVSFYTDVIPPELHERLVNRAEDFEFSFDPKDRLYGSSRPLDRLTKFWKAVHDHYPDEMGKIANAWQQIYDQALREPRPPMYPPVKGE